MSCRFVLLKLAKFLLAQATRVQPLRSCAGQASLHAASVDNRPGDPGRQKHGKFWRTSSRLPGYRSWPAERRHSGRDPCGDPSAGPRGVLKAAHVYFVRLLCVLLGRAKELSHMDISNGASLTCPDRLSGAGMPSIFAAEIGDVRRFDTPRHSGTGGTGSRRIAYER